MTTTDKIFVTGATGFIGTRLVQALIDRGHTVRALCRRNAPEPPPGLDCQGGGPLKHPRVELARGDVRDRNSLRMAMKGCSRVFHLAAYAKNWAPDPDTYFDVNVQGMRNVFEVAKECGVRRLVWTSTFVTLGPTRRGQTGNEETPRITNRYFTEYEETKALAEKEALRYALEGVPATIVNPTRVYGPGHLTEGNALSLLIDQYDRGKAPILLNRGVNVGNYVFVDDVVQGHILAMEKGRIGQRYILGGESVSLKTFFRLIDQVSGKRHLQIPIFRPGAILFAWLQKKRAEWLRVYPQITPGWVRTFLVDWAYTSEKAKRELGYQPTPLAEGIRITYEWLQRTRSSQS